MGKDEVRSSYDSSSEYWLKKSRVSERYLSLIEGSIQPDMTVLDLGCGGGRMSFLLAGKARRIVGCDLSPALVEGAREKAKDQPGMVFVQGDLESPSAWDDCLKANDGEEFDMIISNVALRKDALRLDRVLENAGIVLAPKGRIILRIESSGDLPEIGCPLPCYHLRDVRSFLEVRGYRMELLEEERFSQRFSSFSAFRDFLERTSLMSHLVETHFMDKALDRARSLEGRDGIRVTRSYLLLVLGPLQSL